MADIIRIAEAVAAEIGDGAEVELAPEYSLKDVKERTRIVVVPAGVAHKTAARGIREDLHTVQVGVMRKATEDDLIDLVGYVETLAVGFLHKWCGGAVCIEAKHSPLYVPDHMRERRQFTGVIELVFKAMDRTL